MYQWNVPTSLDTVRRSMDRRRDVNEYRLQLIRHQQRTDSHTTVVLWHDQPRYSLNHLSFSNALGKDLDSRALSSPAGDTSSTGTLQRHRQYDITTKYKERARTTDLLALFWRSESRNALNLPAWVLAAASRPLLALLPFVPVVVVEVAVAAVEAAEATAVPSVPASAAPAVALPPAAACWTTTQLPKLPAVLKETRHLSPVAPPEHVVPAGIWTDSCTEPVEVGRYRARYIVRRMYVHIQ